MHALNESVLFILFNCFLYTKICQFAFYYLICKINERESPREPRDTVCNCQRYGYLRDIASLLGPPFDCGTVLVLPRANRHLEASFIILFIYHSKLHFHTFFFYLIIYCCIKF